MTDFLDRVLKEKEGELARKKRDCPVRVLEDRISGQPVRDFRKAIACPGGIIAEVKKKSPTAAAFLQNTNPHRLAAVYEDNGASGISIVTDQRNFGTSLVDLARVRSAVALPVLAKDFIIDDYQVMEARAAGADAILLIARILSAEVLRLLLDLTHNQEMGALVECHDEADLVKAIDAGANTIGINNRNLETLEVSLETTWRLVPLIPPRAICVSESGIHGREEIEALLSVGVDAFLVGGALLDAPDPGEKLRELLGTRNALEKRSDE